jgi:DNA-binding beta-propeller fold protein YncE
LASAALLLAASAHADIFVSSEKDNAILQLDTDGKVIRTIAVCKRPRHMAWAHDKQQIMAACGDSDQIAVVDVKTAKQIDALPTGESPEIFALSPDAKTVYVSVEDDSLLAAYDVASKKPLFSVKTGAEPEGVLATADGKFVYVTSEVANAVYNVDVTTR